MKKSIVFFLGIAMMLSVVSCGKSDKTGDDAKDKKKTEVKADDKKVEDKKVKADTIDNLFVVLDQAIKNGSMKDAGKLYDANSQKKLKAALELMPDGVGDGLAAQIKFEISNRGKYSTPLKVISKKSGKVTVKWPSGKTTAGIAVVKKGSSYKINLMKSPGAELLE